MKTTYRFITLIAISALLPAICLASPSDHPTPPPPSQVPATSDAPSADTKPLEKGLKDSAKSDEQDSGERKAGPAGPAVLNGKVPAGKAAEHSISGKDGKGNVADDDMPLFKPRRPGLNHTWQPLTVPKRPIQTKVEAHRPQHVAGTTQPHSNKSLAAPKDKLVDNKLVNNSHLPVKPPTALPVVTAPIARSSAPPIHGTGPAYIGGLAKNTKTTAVLNGTGLKRVP